MLPETSVTTYQSTPRNIPENRRSIINSCIRFLILIWLKDIFWAAGVGRCPMGEWMVDCFFYRWVRKWSWPISTRFRCACEGMPVPFKGHKVLRPVWWYYWLRIIKTCGVVEGLLLPRRAYEIWWKYTKWFKFQSRWCGRQNEFWDCEAISYASVLP